MIYFRVRTFFFLRFLTPAGDDVLAFALVLDLVLLATGVALRRLAAGVALRVARRLFLAAGAPSDCKGGLCTLCLF